MLIVSDGNGSISATELASILKKMGTEASESELKVSLFLPLPYLCLRATVVDCEPLP